MSDRSSDIKPSGVIGVFGTLATKFGFKSNQGN